jgi:uncharacterized phage-like protein YoqJ
MQVVAVTGHSAPRLGGFGDETRRRLYGLALDHLPRVCPSSVLVGLALGWEQASAMACMDLQIPFTATLPFEGLDARWPPSDRRRHQELLQAAKEVVLVTPGPYASWKQLERDRWLLRHSQHLLTLWDGSEEDRVARTIDVALEQSVPITNLWTEWVHRLRDIGG